MNNKNNNYRVMKFLEPLNKKDIAKGYVRLDIRGIRGTIIVSLENLGDVKTTSEVYLYKDKINKIKLGNVNNKKGMIKKFLTFGNNGSIEDYNICGVVKDKKIVLYANLFNTISPYDITKLEEANEAKTLEISEPPNVAKENLESVEKKINKIENKKVEDTVLDHEEVAESVVEFDNSIDPEQENKVEDSNEELEQNEELERIELAKEKEEKEGIVDEEVNNNDEVEEIEDIKSSVVGTKSTTSTKEAEVESAARKVMYKNKFEENLYNVLKEHKKLEPLSVKIKNLSWWKVSYNDRGLKNGLLPYYNQIISSYYPYPMSSRVTTCNILMKKYGHYLFGIYKEKDNIQKFVYGIPGEFKRDEQPYKGVTGFKNWSYKNKSEEGEYGYWLAFVDSNTGEVTDPPQIVLSK